MLLPVILYQPIDAMVSSLRTVEILDCTVRDGAYVKNQQLTAEDTYKLSSLAESAGFDYVEVGHGLGVGGYRKAPASPISDTEFCAQAARAAKHTKWGTFAIAGICSDEELEAALMTKPEFVRIGMDPGQEQLALPMLKTIAAHGVVPMAFFMKSYAWELPDILRAAEQCVKNHARFLYIVDSAGTMIPEEVTALTQWLLNIDPHVKVGFHGHNNLGLATANSLAAVKAGASIIDCSLMGIGRSAGNCVMEQLLFALMRYHIATNVDVYKVLEFSEIELKKIYPEMEMLKSADIVFGYSGFHSQFAKRVKAAAELHGVLYYQLVVELCKITQSEPSEEDIAMAVAQLKHTAKPQLATSVL